MISGTITWRTTLRFATLVTVTTVLLLAAGLWLLDRELLQGQALLHQGEARELLGCLAGAEHTPEAVSARVLRDSVGDAEWFFIQIHDDAGKSLFRSANLGQAVLPDLSPEGSNRLIRLPGVGLVQVSEIRSDGWHIQVGSPPAREGLLLRDYLKVATRVIALAALASLAVGYGFSRVTLRPVREITATAKRISGDNLRDRIPVRAVRDELSDLGRVLNQTFDRLESSYEQVRRFTADASHELKTPLAILRLHAERLRKNAGRPEDTAIAEDFLETIGRMQTLIERLLFLARADGGAVPLVLKPLPTEAFARDFAEDASALVEEVGATFQVVACDPGAFAADEALLRQLLLNLVANAARVSPRGGVVALSIHRTELGWDLKLEDDGPGLPEDQLERVFGRFIRIEHKSSTKEADSGAPPTGHGLGLAICRSIAQLHGGSIRAANRSGRPGLSLTVQLPA